MALTRVPYLITSDVEQFDIDILKADLTDNLTVGFTTTEETLGSDTITPDTL